MSIRSFVSLKKYNTFGVDVKASLFTSVKTTEELHDILEEYRHHTKFILGGGSNILLTKDINALVIHINLKGKNIVKEDEEFVWVNAQAGENWHEFVLWTLNQNFGGLQNLSLIPGNIGTAPIQNIGAYGVELKDTMDSCHAIDINTLETKGFTNKECKFGYRDSIFKNEVKGQYIITDVTFKLSKINHNVDISYGAIATELAKKNITHPTIQDVSQAVITIRQSKLPDPKVLGNSGSFFKNPVVPISVLKKIQENYPEVPSYYVSDKTVKIPAGWLIEKAGFKGKQFGNAGVHKDQALVLVNYGNATGKEILDLAWLIIHTIKQEFDISIEPEVNIL